MTQTLETSAPIKSRSNTISSASGPLIHDEVLGILAKQLDDIEGLRKATNNRMSALTRGEPDEDGVVRGLGLDDGHIAVVATRNLLGEETHTVTDPLTGERTSVKGWGLAGLEEQVIKSLQRQMRNHPLGPFLASKKGVGEKQGARLLASIGDPYWMTRFEKIDTNHVMVESRPRTVSELWAYCGYSVIDGHSQRRTKGQLSNWKNDARMRAYLVATSCIKQMDGEYRAIYDMARLKASVAVDKDGKELSLLHQHNRALRAVSKELLKDLWVEAKRLHEEAAN